MGEVLLFEDLGNVYGCYGCEELSEGQNKSGAVSRCLECSGKRFGEEEMGCSTCTDIDGNCEDCPFLWFDSAGEVLDMVENLLK
jgi:hypothetical protein